MVLLEENQNLFAEAKVEVEAEAEVNVLEENLVKEVGLLETYQINSLELEEISDLSIESGMGPDSKIIL